MGGPLGDNCALVGVAMTTSEDNISLVGGIALEDPSAVVLVSALLEWSWVGWCQTRAHGTMHVAYFF
jgi:hypothetical protein